MPPANPYGAPRAPTFDIGNLIESITIKVNENRIQVYLFIALCVAVAVYALILIWNEYKAHPIKHRPKKWGKIGKLSDMIKKK